MEQSSAQPGVLLRFRGGEVRQYLCVDPLKDIPEAQQPGDVDLFKINHSVFYQNAAAFQTYFKLHVSTMNLLETATRRSEFFCRDEYLTITLRYPVFATESGTFDIYSASLLLFQNRLLLLNPDSDTDLFDLQLEGLTDDSSGNHSRSIPQLARLMAGSVFHAYTNSLENFGDVLNKLEDDIIDSDSKAVFAMTTLVRKQNIFLQQTILPLKEMSFNMRHAESALVTPDIDSTLHIMSDQIQRIVDSAGMLSQINSGLLDIYSNAQGNRMNEIMRTLTLFSVLTLPVSVISGFYGMNFVNLPGLKWQYAVAVTVGTMLFCMLLIFWFCHRKKIL